MISAGILLFSLGMLAQAEPTAGRISVLTQRYNNARTGANLSETILKPANVKAGEFGKLFSMAVAGNILAQPLLVASLQVGKVQRDVLYVATAKNNVYAFDANSGQLIWRRSLGPSVPAHDITIQGRTHWEMGESWEYRDLYPDIGITGTPVIDIRAGTIFVVAKTKEAALSKPKYQYRLHALSINTGVDLQAPVEIKGSVAGSSREARKHRVAFNSFIHLNRPGLLLLDGNLYVAFGSLGDAGPFHGWIFRFKSAAIHRPPVVFCTTPDAGDNHGETDDKDSEWNRGGIWQSGTGIAADSSGFIYVAVGDGVWDGKRNFGGSVLKLDMNLNIVDWFTPSNHADLNGHDLDVGSTGVVVISEKQIAAGSKEGKLYILDSAHPRHLVTDASAQDSAHEQQIQVSKLPEHAPPDCSNCYHHLHGAPVIWQPSDGLRLYIWPEMESLKLYRSVEGQFIADSESMLSAPIPADHVHTAMPGGILALSASGSAEDSAIVWSSMPLSEDANRRNVAGVVRAFAASDIQHELWNSEQNPADHLGNFAKFCPPLIANGKVFIATFAPETRDANRTQTGPAQIVVYGLQKH